MKHVLQVNNRNYVKGYDCVKGLRQSPPRERSRHARRVVLAPPAPLDATGLPSPAPGRPCEGDGGREREDARAREAQVFKILPLDVALEMTLLTQRIVVRTMFGSEVGGEDEKIAQAFATALTGYRQSFLDPLVDWTTAHTG